MTIEKGAAWGEEIDRPADLRIAGGDREFAELVGDGTGRPTALAGGDLLRTLGATPPGDRVRMRRAPIDLVTVVLDDDVRHTAAAHVVARSPWSRGSWWFGPILVVMNAEFIGERDVAPRGHPNDGRVETLLAMSMSLRDRWSARSRSRTGAHVPHPDIETRSVRSADWRFERPRTVLVDGVAVGRSRTLAVEVRPDAASVYY